MRSNFEYFLKKNKIKQTMCNNNFGLLHEYFFKKKRRLLSKNRVRLRLRDTSYYKKKKSILL